MTYVPARSDATALPASFRETAAPGPAVATSVLAAAGVVVVVVVEGGGGGAAPAVKRPRMTVGWASQTNAYVPSTNVTVQTTVSIRSTDVDMSTPGPERWKL